MLDLMETSAGEEDSPQSSNYNPEFLERDGDDVNVEANLRERDPRGGNPRGADEIGYNDQKKNDPISNNDYSAYLDNQESADANEEGEYNPLDGEDVDDIETESGEETDIEADLLDSTDAEYNTIEDGTQDLPETQEEENSSETTVGDGTESQEETDEPISEDEEDQTTDETEDNDTESDTTPTTDEENEEDVEDDDSDTTVTVTPIEPIEEDEKVKSDNSDANGKGVNDHDRVDKDSEAQETAEDKKEVGVETTNIISLETTVYVEDETADKYARVADVQDTDGKYIVSVGFDKDGTKIRAFNADFSLLTLFIP